MIYTSICLNTIGVFALAVGVLAKAPKHNSAHFVFSTFFDGTGQDGAEGWSIRASTAYVAAVGVLMSQYTILGFDASAHLCEETRKAVRDAPLGLLSAIGFSAVMGFFLIICLLFSVQDFDTVRNAKQPVLQILTDACGEAGGLVLMVLIMLCVWHCGLFSLVCISPSKQCQAYVSQSTDFKLSNDVRFCPRWWYTTQTPHHRPWIPLTITHCTLRRHLLFRPCSTIFGIASSVQWDNFDRNHRTLSLLRYSNCDGTRLASEFQARSFQSRWSVETRCDHRLLMDQFHHCSLLSTDSKPGHQRDFQLHVCGLGRRRHLCLWLLGPLGQALVHRSMSPPLQDLYPTTGFLG